MPQATVKRYDSVTRTGVLLADDGSTEFEIDGEGLDSGMFRFLRPGQRVTFDLVDEAGAGGTGGTRVMNIRIGIA